MISCELSNLIEPWNIPFAPFTIPLMNLNVQNACYNEIDNIIM